MFAGKKGNEVLVQGGVIDDLARHLIDQYGVPKRYIEVLDKTKKWATYNVCVCFFYYVTLMGVLYLDAERCVCSVLFVHWFIVGLRWIQKERDKNINGQSTNALFNSKNCCVKFIVILWMEEVTIQIKQTWSVEAAFTIFSLYESNSLNSPFNLWDCKCQILFLYKTFTLVSNFLTHLFFLKKLLLNNDFEIQH